MDNNTKKEFTVNGFLLGTKEDVELAKTELVTVKYIDKKIENRSANTVLSVYQGALERRLFRTPVGYSYLHDLQKRMLQGGIPREDIQPIPLYQVYNNSHLEDVPKRIVTVAPKKKKDSSKIKIRALLTVNIVLIIIIVLLFAISINGNVPTVINYKNVIENEYASWQQELTERENKIREKERELNIEAPAEGVTITE